MDVGLHRPHGYSQLGADLFVAQAPGQELANVPLALREECAPLGIDAVVAAQAGQLLEAADDHRRERRIKDDLPLYEREDGPRDILAVAVLANDGQSPALQQEQGVAIPATDRDDAQLGSLPRQLAQRRAILALCRDLEDENRGPANEPAHSLRRGQDGDGVSALPVEVRRECPRPRGIAHGDRHGGPVGRVHAWPLAAELDRPGSGLPAPLDALARRLALAWHGKQASGRGVTKPSRRSSAPPSILLETLGSVSIRFDREGSPPIHLEPKRSALLAYLAIEGFGHAVSRDVVTALLWPERGTSDARAALRQALHYLTRRLGMPVVETRGWNEVQLAPVIRCDATRMLALLDEGRPHEAVRLYRGEFLKGFYYKRGSRAFEAWLDEARSRLRTKAFLAMMDLSFRCEARGDTRGAARWAERGLELSPYHEGLLRRLLSLYAVLGDHGRAEDTLRGFESRLRQLGVPFSTATVRNGKAPTDAMILAGRGDGTRAGDFLATIIEALGLVVVVVDDQLEVAVWSTKAASHWGLEAHRAVGRPLMELTMGLPMESIAGAARDAMGEVASPTEMMVEARDRHGCPIRCHVAVIRFPFADGTTGALIAIDSAPL